MHHTLPRKVGTSCHTFHYSHLPHHCEINGVTFTHLCTTLCSLLSPNLPPHYYEINEVTFTHLCIALCPGRQEPHATLFITLTYLTTVKLMESLSHIYAPHFLHYSHLTFLFTTVKLMKSLSYIYASYFS